MDTTWSDLHAMLADIHAHVKAHGPVELADDPMRRRIGYRLIRDPGVSWHIGLTDVKRSLDATPNPTIAECLKTAAGRLALAGSSLRKEGVLPRSS